MSKYNTDCCESMKAISDIFPIEIDLPSTLMEERRDSANDDDDDELDDQLEGKNSQNNVTVDDDLIGINN